MPKKAKPNPDEPLTRGNIAEIITPIITPIITSVVTAAITANNVHLATKDDLLAARLEFKQDLLDSENRLKQHIGDEIGSISNDMLTSVEEVFMPVQQSVKRLEQNQNRMIQALSSQNYS